MSARRLLLRSLRHFWRPNVAVVLGVAAAAAVLGGSLVVGDSVRGSLAAGALARLGATTHTVAASRPMPMPMRKARCPGSAVDSCKRGARGAVRARRA